MRVIRGNTANPQTSTAGIFTGHVESHTYVDQAVAEHLRMTLVRFAPGGRTKWHTHSFEQGLLITEGRGIVADERRQHIVEPGDIVIVPAREKHWHGATTASAMAHISITTPGETTVLEAVERISPDQ